MDAIATINLTKKYDNIIAVDHVSFKVEQNEIFGLLGPNGAGKTTIIKMLSILWLLLQKELPLSVATV